MWALAASLQAALWLPSVFSDNLVLQAGDGTPVFGRADAGAAVEVSFAPETGKVVSTSAIADAEGRFLARLGALQAGAKGTLTVKSGAEEKTFKNALVGEVWLCSGQSNMEFIVARGPDNAPRVAQAQKEAAAANGEIRMFRVRTRGMDAPEADVEPRVGVWEVVTPENVSDCSAVSWNFAVKVRGQTGFPVGLIISSWGGTCIETWLSAQAIQDSGVAQKVQARHEVDLRLGAAAMADFQKKKEAFLRKYPSEQEQSAHKAERPSPPKKAYSPKDKNVPTRLYNGMINGLLPYGLRGMLWYQGEHNANVRRAAYYGPLAQSLVKSRRAEFQNPDLAFYYVELANFKPAQTEPVEAEGMGLIRESQGAVLTLLKTGAATAVDVGDADDIHPTDKKTVGNRLAAMALNDLYSKPSLCRSPEYKSSQVTGDAVIVSLNYADGLRARGALEGFAIRADKGDWLWAEDVKILPDGTISVRSAKVSAPAAVRYGWANNPKSTVENSAGLPLRPFRTDIPQK